MIQPISGLAGQISRRQFFKIIGIGLAAAGALSGANLPLASWLQAPLQPVQIPFGDRLVRGTPSGQILESLDQGGTWQLLADLGAHCAVVGLQNLRGKIFARVALASHTFWLSSPDAKTWRTVS